MCDAMKSDPIYKQDAIDAIMDGMCSGWYCDVVERIKALPAADVTPVRHGRWETVEGWDGDEYYRCSECGEAFVLIDGTPSENGYFFCPHCGADMREKNE